MAVDTFQKRYSLLVPIPLPDGDIANVPDRKNLLWLFAVDAAAPPSEIKSVSKVLLADIKSVAGVPIADIKKVAKVNN